MGPVLRVTHFARVVERMLLKLIFFFFKATIMPEVVMKRGLIILSAAMILALWISAVSADDFPATSAPAAGPRQPAAVSAQQQLIYGYVPPPPIRHTWPGGYKVLFHELFNTLSQHILGHY
jgi:hypothetical protein